MSSSTDVVVASPIMGLVCLLLTWDPEPRLDSQTHYEWYAKWERDLLCESTASRDTTHESKLIFGGFNYFLLNEFM